MINLTALAGIMIVVLAFFSGAYGYSLRDATKMVTVPARQLPAKPAPSTKGGEAQNVVCEYSNGWNVCPPVPGADIPEFFRYYKPVTGLAIGPYKPGEACQPFENTRICVSTIHGSPEVGLANTGLEELERRKKQARSDSRPDPVVEDWIRQLVQGGLNRDKAFGRVISPPECQTGICYQFLDRVLVEWPEGATSGDDVHPVPVERLRLYPPPAPEIQTEHQEERPLPWTENYLMILMGIITVILGLLGGYLTLTGLMSEGDDNF